MEGDGREQRISSFWGCQSLTFHENLIHPRKNASSNQEQQPKKFTSPVIQAFITTKMNAVGKRVNPGKGSGRFVMFSHYRWTSTGDTAFRLSQSPFPPICSVNPNLLPITADTLQMLLWIMLLNQVKMCHFRALFAYPR